MRFTINKDEFLKGLQTAGHAVGAKSTDPVLMNLKMEITSRGLEITGSDGDFSVWTLVPLLIGENVIIRDKADGAILVDSGRINDLVRKIDSAEVTVEVIDDAVLKVKYDKGAVDLRCINADQYPDIDLSESDDAFEVGTRQLMDLVEQTAFAAAQKSTSRPALVGINLKANNGNLVAVASDANRLSRKTVSIPGGVSFSAIVPAKSMQDVTRMLDGYDRVRISHLPAKMVFAFGNTLISTNVIAGEYPMGDNIIPSIFNYHLEVNALELQSAIERISILNDDKTRVVKLSMDEGKVEVSTRSAQTGSGCEALGSFHYTGQRLDMTFNATLVLDAIKAVRGQDVTISFIGELKPFVVSNPHDDSVVELITPMRSRS